MTTSPSDPMTATVETDQPLPPKAKVKSQYDVVRERLGVLMVNQSLLVRCPPGIEGHALQRKLSPIATRMLGRGNSTSSQVEIDGVDHVRIWRTA